MQDVGTRSHIKNSQLLEGQQNGTHSLTETTKYYWTNTPQLLKKFKIYLLQNSLCIPQAWVK